MLVNDSVAADATQNSRFESLPLSVTNPAPSMLVSTPIVFTVTSIVTGLAPQLKVTLPPPDSAVFSAVSVQLLGVPLPTTPAANAGRGATATANSTTTTRPSDAMRA